MKKAKRYIFVFHTGAQKSFFLYEDEVATYIEARNKNDLLSYVCMGKENKTVYENPTYWS